MDGLSDEIARAAAFRSALRRFAARTEMVAAEAGLSDQRYNLLLLIKAATVCGEPATITALANQLALEQTAVTELVNRAEAAGVVERVRSDLDGRVSIVRLTEEGEERFLAAFTALRDDRVELARAFGDLHRRFRATIGTR